MLRWFSVRPLKRRHEHDEGVLRINMNRKQKVCIVICTDNTEFTKHLQFMYIVYELSSIVWCS